MLDESLEGALLVIDTLEELEIPYFNLLHYRILSKVDVFIPKGRPYDRLKFERRILQQIDDEPPRAVYLTSPEDAVLTKLEWFRLGHEKSDRQWRDILGVLKTLRGQLDVEYLRRWAVELGVADLLDRAVQQANE